MIFISCFHDKKSESILITFNHIALQLDSTDEEDEQESTGKKKYLRCNSSAEDLAEKDHSSTEENDCESNSSKIEDETPALIQKPELAVPHTKLTALEIPSKDTLIETLMHADQIAESSIVVEDDNTKEEVIAEEHVLQRINSHKETKSYQLGKQLSCTWSTGAGPRIGCLRDYPSPLQCHALEQVNLSPRTKRRLRLEFPSPSSSTNLFRSSSCHSTVLASAVNRC